MTDTRSTITTADGCRLAVREAGDRSSGRTVVVLHGWSQSQATFDRLVPLLAQRHHVVTYDHRGHGASATPDHGARIARLARDLAEVLDGLGIASADLVGHSMGASVLWSFVDQYGTDRIDSLTVVDQPSACVVLPWMDVDEGAAAGAILDFAGAEGFVAAVGGAEAYETRRAFLVSMLSKDLPDQDLAFLLEENLRMPGGWGARLLLDHVMQDWRDVLPRIDVPTLVVGGEVSHVDAASQRWTADHIPGARLRVFTAAEGGSHFPFFENPGPFTAELTGFLAGLPAARRSPQPA